MYREFFLVLVIHFIYYMFMLEKYFVILHPLTFFVTIYLHFLI